MSGAMLRAALQEASLEQAIARLDTAMDCAARDHQCEIMWYDDATMLAIWHDAARHEPTPFGRVLVALSVASDGKVLALAESVLTRTDGSTDGSNVRAIVRLADAVEQIVSRIGQCDGVTGVILMIARGERIERVSRLATDADDVSALRTLILPAVPRAALASRPLPHASRAVVRHAKRLMRAGMVLASACVYLATLTTVMRGRLDTVRDPRNPRDRRVS